MQTPEERLLSALCTNKDVGIIMNENKALWGDFAPPFEYLVDSYYRYRQVPDANVMAGKFPDLEIEEIGMSSEAALDELKQQFVKDKTQWTIREMTAMYATATPAEVQAFGMNMLSRLSKYTHSARDVDISDIELAEEHYRNVKNSVEDRGIPFGIDAIDKNYPTGMAPGNIITVFGYSGKGKSFFGDIIAKNAYMQGKNVLILSFEMSAEDTRDRIFTLAGNGKHNINQFMDGSVLDDESWKDSLPDTGGSIIVLGGEYGKEITPHAVGAKVDEHKIDLVIVDYLQLGMDNNLSESLFQRITNMSREYKMLAQAKKIPVVLVSAVKDAEVKRTDAPPMVSQLIHSRSVEYDSSLALSVHKYLDHEDMKDEKDIVEITCRKNRYGSEFDLIYEVDFARGVWDLQDPYA